MWKPVFNQNEFDQIIARLRAQKTDDANVEAKSCSRGLSKDVWETVSSFANTAGGLLLLGVSEKEGFAAVEEFDPERVRDQFVAGMGDGGGGSHLTNPPQYAIHRHSLGGKQVLAIEIQELDVRLKPCYISDRGIQAGSYKRIDDKDIRLSPTEVFELVHVLDLSQADSALVAGASEKDLDQDVVEALLTRMEQDNTRAFRGVATRDGKLARLGVTDGEGGVRLAGLLAMGYYPQQFFPLLVIDVAAHLSTEKGRTEPVRFVDRKLCEGSLGDAIGDAVAAVARNLRHTALVEGSERADQLEIPEEVLREAIANAVVHREYHEYFLGQSVAVDVFLDRVEITSPGGLWGGKTLENIADGISRCRNALLMKVMRSLSHSASGGLRVEGQGSGIAMMNSVMAQRGLPLPRYQAGADYFKVVFGRTPGVAAIDGRLDPAGASRTSGERIKALLSPETPRTAQELAAETGMKIDTVRSVLRRLVKQGSVVPTAQPTSKKRSYLLVL